MDKNPDIHSLLQHPAKLLQNPEVQQLIQDPTFQQLLNKNQTLNNIKQSTDKNQPLNNIKQSTDKNQPLNNIKQSTDKNLKEKLKEKLKLKQISRMTKTNKEKYLESTNEFKK